MPDADFRLHLYIAGGSPNSRRAVANLARLSATAPATWQIETVDVFEQPARAMADGIMLTPQLVILSATGRRCVVGDLSDSAVLLAALGTDSGMP
jgi:circadian clock protein KaiB